MDILLTRVGAWLFVAFLAFAAMAVGADQAYSPEGVPMPRC